MPATELHPLQTDSQRLREAKR